jgi:hypothetical protein
MNSGIMGILIGLIFGVILVWFGPGKAFAVVGFMALGWLLSKLATRELDVIAFLEWVSRRGPQRMG